MYYITAVGKVLEHNGFSLSAWLIRTTSCPFSILFPFNLALAVQGLIKLRPKLHKTFLHIYYV